MNGGTTDGHGWVAPRADGAKAKCGGPGMCRVCQAEAAALAANQTLKLERTGRFVMLTFDCGSDYGAMQFYDQIIEGQRSGGCTIKWQADEGGDGQG